MLKIETPGFIPPDLWPSNAADYSTRSKLQEKVYQHRINNPDELKHRLRAEWSNLDHVVIAAAIHRWNRHLSACVKAAGGGHFQHRF